ncbi:MAG TPA: hypothetical protein VFF79_06095 [Conexibacter sp.]|jgi:hypothetical protein|nr:hypothetical protein [Conexibacter sp.]
MARPRRFEIDELLLRPGTYFNPHTEVLLVVDDSPEVDQATLEADAAAGEGEWVLVSDEQPIDEPARDELLERFQATYHEGGPGAALDDTGEDELDDEDDELEPDPDVDELE